MSTFCRSMSMPLVPLKGHKVETPELAINLGNICLTPKIKDLLWKIHLTDRKTGGKKNKRTAGRKEDRLVNWYLTPSRQRRLHQCGSSCSSKRIIRRRGKGRRSIKTIKKKRVGVTYFWDFSVLSIAQDHPFSTDSILLSSEHN